MKIIKIVLIFIAVLGLFAAMSLADNPDEAKRNFGAAFVLLIMSGVAIFLAFYTKINLPTNKN